MGVKWVFVYSVQMGESMLLRQLEARPARLPGYQRAFNHRSTLLWGTPEQPCPTLGLSPGDDCRGLACQLSQSRGQELARKLEPVEAREELGERELTVRVNGEREIKAKVWVTLPELAERGERMSPNDLETALRAAHGTAGNGIEYVRTLVHALQGWDLRDPLIDALWERVGAWRPH